MSMSRLNLILIFVVCCLTVGAVMQRRPVSGKKSSEPIETETDQPCDGTLCGCFRTKCWIYADLSATAEGDLWCYARQLEEQSGRRKKFQSCNSDRDCFMDRECFDCTRYTGNEDTTKKVC